MEDRTEPRERIASLLVFQGDAASGMASALRRALGGGEAGARAIEEALGLNEKARGATRSLLVAVRAGEPKPFGPGMAEDLAKAFHDLGEGLREAAGKAGPGPAPDPVVALAEDVADAAATAASCVRSATVPAPGRNTVLDQTIVIERGFKRYDEAATDHPAGKALHGCMERLHDIADILRDVAYDIR